MKLAVRYYALAFLEGVGVLTAELLGAKMLAPYYGSSIFIWTTVIGITLLCLTLGYFVGSRLAARAKGDELIFLLFVVGAFFLALMPITTHLLFRAFSGANLFVGCGLSTFFLLGPPLISLGATSPILIQRITRQVEESGRVAGNVYAWSTLGGIITTFSMGFVVIPAFGISQPVSLIALLVVLGANALLTLPRRAVQIGASLALLLPLALVFFRSSTNSEEVTLLYEEEGILGQLKVVDTWDATQEVRSRKMLVNGIPQTNVVKGDFEARSFFHYVHLLATLASMKPAGSEVLICGLGGGSLVAEFEKLGFNVDAVDIDGRQLELAVRYFYLDKSGLTFFTDDARHYISTTSKRYDIIVLDLLVAEAQPDHLYTLESFASIREKLRPDGLLLLNFQGYFNGPKGRAARSIFRTLQEAGFEAHVATGGEGVVGDLIFAASPGKVRLEDISPRRLNSCCVEISQADIFAQNPRNFVISDPDLSDSRVLRDDQPVLDLLRLSTILEFRRNKIKSIARKELEDDVQLFK